MWGRQEDDTNRRSGSLVGCGEFLWLCCCSLSEMFSVQEFVII